MEQLYVAKGAAGLLKIGRSKDPRKRLLYLRREFKERGDVIVRFEACQAVESAHQIEWGLQCDLGRISGRQSGREWFVDGDFDTALGLAKKYTAERIAREAHARTPAGIAAIAKAKRQNEIFLADMRARKQADKASRAIWRAEWEKKSAERKRRRMGAMPAMVAFFLASA